MDSTQRVQFEENDDSQSVHRNKNSQVTWRAPRKGMMEWLVVKGYAKDETEASNMLLAGVIAFVVMAILVSFYFNGNPAASIELQRSKQWLNSGHTGSPPPYYQPTTP